MDLTTPPASHSVQESQVQEILSPSSQGAVSPDSSVTLTESHQAGTGEHDISGIALNDDDPASTDSESVSNNPNSAASANTTAKENVDLETARGKEPDPKSSGLPRRLYFAVSAPKANLTYSPKLSWSEQFDHLFRAFGLEAILQPLLSTIEKGNDEEPEPEPVLVGSLMVVFLSPLIHTVPVVVVGVLYWANREAQYLGSSLPGPVGHATAKSFGIQVAAKLHELTIVASLGVIIFCFVRGFLLKRIGAPFAVLSAGFQWTAISYLWSKEFWAILLSQTIPFFQRALFITTLALCTILGASVGPASAIAMQPQLNWWQAGGARVWWNATWDQMFPETLNESSIPSSQCNVAGTIGCPSESWRTLNVWFQLLQTQSTFDLPRMFSVKAGISIVQMGLRSGFGTLITSATMPPASISNGLQINAQWWYAAVQRSQIIDQTTYWDNLQQDIAMGDIYQPLVGVLCAWSNFTSTEGPLYPEFVTLVDGSTRVTLQVNVSEYAQWIQTDFTNSSLAARVHWISVDPDISGLNATEFGAIQGAAIVTLPNPNNDGGSVLGCTIMAKYTTLGRLYIDEYGFASTDYDLVITMPTSHTDRFCTIDPTWADYLNPIIPSLNSTVFEQQLITAGVWTGNSAISCDPTNSVESILAMELAYGMGNVEANAQLEGNVIDYDSGPWWRLFLPQPQPSTRHGQAGEPWNLTGVQLEGLVTAFMDVQIQGYAFDWPGSLGTRIAIAILQIYVAMACLHIAYLFLRRRTSVAWQSISDLIAIAFASEPPVGRLSRTGATVRMIQTLEQPVRVVVKEGKLQLSESRDNNDFESVQVNVKY